MQNQKKLTSPFGWVGGKSRLAKDIVKHIPQHTLYIEVFGGALSVLYAKPKFLPIQKYREVVNDINGELINLHRQIQTHPETLQQFLSNMLISRDIFNAIKKGCYMPHNDIERAAIYYYLLTQSFGSKGENFAMAAKSRGPKDIYKSFMKWSQRLRFVTIEHMSYDKLITEYDKAEAFFYCDPPYIGTESYYKLPKSFTIDDHIKLRDLLSQIKGKFLLSYNDCEVARDLYKDFYITQTKEITYTLCKNKNKSVKEIFISNYKLDG